MKTYKAGSGQRAAGSGQRAAGSGQRTVLYAVRSATALNRLLDTLPVFAGDHRVSPVFTLVPGSDFSTDALAALDSAGARTIPWREAVQGGHDLVVAASPNGPLPELSGPLVLLPHGAGFNKRLPHARAETTPSASASAAAAASDVASGLHPRQLLRGQLPLASVHALAHPSQLTRLAQGSPVAAERAAVVGDPTLDRMLASRSRRERYRDALRTGGRRLVAVVSTWGKESLLKRRPELPGRLTAELPYDAYQVALVLHPNEHVERGGLTLHEHMEPALAAGLLLPRPHEEWAAVLTAADCVLTDHGSTALYPAALDRPLLGCYDGGTELLPDSPMAELLAHVPRLRPDEPFAAQIDAAVAAHRTGDTSALAATAFAERGRSLEHLRDHCYRLLELEPPPGRPRARLLPVPRTAARRPSGFAARVDVRGNAVSVARYPLNGGPHGGHVVAEDGFSELGEMWSAGLIVRYAPPPAGRDPRDAVWTAGGWTVHTLAGHPGCRSAAAILTSEHCVLRRREPEADGPHGPHGPDGPDGSCAPTGPERTVGPAGPDRTGRPDRQGLLSVRIGIDPSEGEPWVRPDPAAVLSGVHEWLECGGGPLPAMLTCTVGGRRTTVRLAYATDEDAYAEL
ncbi:translation initiation factor 2 [Streptomyces sp. NPDC051569]|uniref:translation initiation factor 2 n=1 Tax=Streptomyces sp. NPDC051569 TaxID=3365661 RepID=UPI0037B3C445